MCKSRREAGLSASGQHLGLGAATLLAAPLALALNQDCKWMHGPPWCSANEQIASRHSIFRAKKAGIISLAVIPRPL